MVKDTQVPFAGLKFNGNPNDFQRWKDAVVAHLVSKTNSRKISEIQAGRAAPRYRPKPVPPAHWLTSTTIHLPLPHSAPRLADRPLRHSFVKSMTSRVRGCRRLSAT
ncbi:hypothetical protein PHYSODRAFT_322429 [Phytophthora sojae]|uniref:Uncharacterized protein n=1 Tax=Phytophthora sojae (strain P6497) TaxID=1094619 RepID=G4YIY0_PHYSP|nr:hypothetical protein PHYSODRAFT_322429 [Phytophthora sojae]EGZ28802.1 hypothetical protein PHYSODRAFT_322429 [Phytophthora sojae]|eukprot:XP_009516077.1 hypothetical protein PHYSODRAFT_322429 [Phytophthora sojae]